MAGGAARHAWKEGVCAGLGWPVDTPAAWRRILGAVTDYADLEPTLLGRVEELIDFVTVDEPHPPSRPTPGRGPLS